MNTADIYICERCGLPIRIPGQPATAAVRFTASACPVCEGCDADSLKALEASIRRHLVGIIGKIHNASRPGDAPASPAAIAARLDVRNGADAALGRVAEDIRAAKTPGERAELALRSERLLSQFAYRSEKRWALATSPTILRHWVSLARKVKRLQETHRTERDCPKRIVDGLGASRYDLNLARLSRLIPENPLAIIRDETHYTGTYHATDGTRANHLLDPAHVDKLKRQTARMRPCITDDLKSILRFAGNYCLMVTDYQEVIEFRNPKNSYLCKYFIADQILIVIDDLWFLSRPGKLDLDAVPAAELVTIYPQTIANSELTTKLALGAYIPNCVDIAELVEIARSI